MMKRFKDWVRRFGIISCLVLVMCFSALAEGETGSTPPDGATAIMGALTDGLSALVPTMLTAVGALVVVGLGIFSAKIAVRIGMQMFKTVTNQ